MLMQICVIEILHIKFYRINEIIVYVYQYFSAFRNEPDFVYIRNQLLTET